MLQRATFSALTISCPILSPEEEKHIGNVLRKDNLCKDASYYTGVLYYVKAYGRKATLRSTIIADYGNEKLQILIAGVNEKIFLISECLLQGLD